MTAPVSVIGDRGGFCVLFCEQKEGTIDRKGGPRNMCDVLDKVESRGIAKGVAKGKAEGEIEGKNQMALLVKKLLDQGRIDDVKRASEDEVYRDQLIKEFGIR